MRIPFCSIDPSTQETLRQYDDLSPNQIEAKLEAAHAAFDSWRQVAVAQRSDVVRRFGAELRRRKPELARLMAMEMGKPLVEGEAEIEKCAWVCEYYSSAGESFLADRESLSDATRSYVTYQPLGIILAIMPWNFPFWQVLRFAAPTLMAGNVVLLKHAPNVTGCAMAIREIIHAAEPERPLLDVLLIQPTAIESVIADSRVTGVTLTGSTTAGRAVASLAGVHLKKTVLELGGSDPSVILEDADIELAAESCVTSRLINTGQSCIAAKRFVVVRPVRKEFEERVVTKMQAATYGNPLEGPYRIGPLARRDLRDHLHQQVQRSCDAGANVLCGGRLPEGRGFFYPPTVLSGVRKGMPAYDEETFGPVAAIIEAENENDAVQIANDSSYGLGASIYSRDADRAEWLAKTRLEAGSCFVNTFVKSDPRLPFGGIKNSGYGRELGMFGIHEFVNIKTVYRR